MNSFWTFLGLAFPVVVLLLAFSGIMIGVNKRKTLNKIRRELVKKHHPDYVFNGYEIYEGFVISNRGRKWIFWKYTDEQLYDDILDISAILELNIKVDEDNYHRIQKEGAIGRAIVGGLLLGGAGAVVGAVTAKEKQKEITNVRSLALEFFVDDLETPTKEIPFYTHRAMDGDGDRTVLIEEAKHDMELISMLYALSARGVDYGPGLKQNALRKAIKVHDLKLKNIGNDNDKQILLAELSQHLTKLHNVVMTSYGDNKVSVIKAVRGITGMGLREAKEIVEGVPSTIKAAAKDEAAELKKTLEEAGASIELK